MSRSNPFPAPDVRGFPTTTYAPTSASARAVRCCDALGHSSISTTAIYIGGFEKQERADQRRQRLQAAFADLGEAA